MVSQYALFVVQAMEVEARGHEDSSDEDRPVPADMRSYADEQTELKNAFLQVRNGVRCAKDEGTHVCSCWSQLSIVTDLVSKHLS